MLDADPASGLVRVEAGITLRALNRELDALGLALPNLGDVDAQSLAGALATGTHGTGARLGNLSSTVEAIELVLGDGSSAHADGATATCCAPPASASARSGIATAVTLRCVPAFRLRGVDRPEPLEDVLASLDERAAAADHFEFFTFPHSPLALTRTNTRTEAPVQHAVAAARAWVERHPARQPRLPRLQPAPPAASRARSRASTG